jgi:RNA polymerase sigma-70 factor, ECF subfamily
VPDTADHADADLISRIARGERAAFDALAARHAGAMQRLARAMTGQDALAADVTQESLVAAYRGAAGYRFEFGSARNWLLAITRNAARRALRPRREELCADIEPKLLELGVAAGWGSDDPGRLIEAAEDAERLVLAIASLALDDREVLLLRDVEGLSGEETARSVDLTVAAMKSRLHRARLRLLAALRESEGNLMAQDRMVGALRCSEVLALLGEYVDGDLPGGDVAEVELHLRGCTVCERFGGRFSRVVRSVRATLGAAPAADEEVLARVRAALGR